MKIDPNAPAFPSEHDTDKYPHGLTVRAEFAKAAMQGILSNGPYLASIGTMTKTGIAQVIARHAAEHADALISELNKES